MAPLLLLAHRSSSNEAKVSDGDEIERLARALQDYLAVRPLAADTARGVREFWLAGWRPAPGAATVEQALLRLERRGVMRRSPLPGGDAVWSAGAPA